MADLDIQFHPEASDEYADAYDWYSQRGERVGAAFGQEVERGLRLIAGAPERWAIFSEQCRRLVLRRFPYSLIHAVYDSEVWVVAVAHSARRPGYRHHRLRRG